MKPQPGRRAANLGIDWIILSLFLFLVVVMMFLIAPIAIVMVNSFNASQFSIFPPEEFSLRWYRRLFTIEHFWDATRLSLIIAVASTVAALVVGTLAAIAFVRFEFRGKSLIWALHMSPAIIPKVAIGLSMFVTFLSVGLYGSVASLILVHLTVILPFAIMILSATLANVDRSLEEAAADLGAAPFRSFLAVTMPQMSAGFVTAGVLIFVLSFDEVEATIFVAKHDAQTLPIEMFNYMERWQDPVVAALSTLLIGLSLLIAMVFVAVRGRDLASSPKGRSP
jgi:putative spermidine/putrescine transport system permease protein